MKLVVFFTRGMSLRGWQQAGILDRELALFRHLSGDFERLAFVTYGGQDDGQCVRDMPGLEVLPNVWRLPANVYSLLAPLLHRRQLRAASVFRTNQINGAWCAVIAKVLFRKKLVVRCGYLWADFVEHLTPSRSRRLVARLLERVVMRAADRIIVAGKHDASAIVRRYGVDAGRIATIPNFVDTRRFQPTPDAAPPSGTILFVGRLEAQKNLKSLIDAVAGLPDARLTVVGDGPLRSILERHAETVGAEVSFLGRVPHEDLPAILHRSQVFVLPSFFEGNPKALVEAMAAGVPVVGTRVAGIEDVIADRSTGLLCGTAAEDIRAALAELLRDASLRSRLSQGALAYVREHCSLPAMADRERDVLRAVSSDA